MRFITTLLLTLCALPASAMAATGELFADYAVLLDRHLEERRTHQGGLISAFDYAAALDNEDSRSRIQEQRQQLAEFDPETLEGRRASVAFWLNSYNFFMIAHILQERPDGEIVETVWDYGGRYNPFVDNIFERKLFTIGGHDYSLDEMEKDILLGEAWWDKGWADARLHFAVNCASVGCPPLRTQLYTADNLDDLLAENTRLTLRGERHLRVEGETLYLTSLFDWYEDEFEREADSVRNWIREHADEETADAMEATDRIRYLDYDWSLNRPENFPEFQ